VFIDTLSFEKYVDGEPWVAYKQFCQHFLAPEALMALKDIRLNQLQRIYIDGVPLDLASRLLPFSTRFRFSLLTHIHLHARSQKHFSGRAGVAPERKVSRIGLLGLIGNLESAIKKLEWKPRGTEWADYYENTSYSKDAFSRKKHVVSQFLDEINPRTVWDLGANVGVFSAIAGEKGIETISFDIDPAAVERNYLKYRMSGKANVLPLLMDLTNPSPGMGWNNTERSSLMERGPTDTVIALALVHHLAISNNVPLARIAEFFSNICRSLIVEFIPKSDPQVKRLLETRKDIFPDYSRNSFEKALEKHFVLSRSEQIHDSGRILYLARGSVSK
jgi:hypothetical protein